jgi:BirA family biotin operon repressor/biotin-[acetyl-CoA-carboxylase] ligase
VSRLDRAALCLGDGQHAVVRASTPSTNDDARQLALQGAPHGTWVVAEEQTAGRGRLGRRWELPADQGLAMTMVLRPSLPPHRVPLLGFAAALAVAALDRRLRIKWPNDVQLPDGRKLAGILAEAEPGDDGVAFVLMGIGVNVSGAPPLPTAGHLGELVSRRREAVAVTVAEELLRWSERLEQGAVEQLVEAWTARSATLGRRVKVGAVEGTAEGIDDSGALWVRDDAGARRPILAGDVQLVRW